MCIFDIDSWLTNITSAEAMEIFIKNKFLGKREINWLNKIDSQELLKLITMVRLFYFHDYYYKVLDDSAMGSFL